MAILHEADGSLYLDAILLDRASIAVLFGFSRAYFMVDMEVPSGYVEFLKGLLPNKPARRSTRRSACRSTARRSSTAISCIT